MISVRCLGVLDWGIGGIDLYRKFRVLHPAVPIVYLSDAGSRPYGLLSPLQMRKRLQHMIALLAKSGASHVVIACNAASTALNDESSDCIDPSFVLPCLGVIRPAIAAILQTRGTGSLLVLGGKRTIESRRYQDALQGSSYHVEALVAQPLSALVEQGKVSGPEVRAAIALVLGSVTRADILVPACTHYMALVPELMALLRPTRIIDPAAETLKHMQRVWDFASTSDSSMAPSRFLTTGNAAQMIEGAMRAFSTPIDCVTEVSLPADLELSLIPTP